MPKRRPIMMSIDGPLGVGLPLTEERILLAANWVKDTTLLYGGSTSTAFTVAGIFARGLESAMKIEAAEPRAPEADGEER